MLKNTNSASRVHSILARVVEQSQDISVYEAWARAFDLSEQRPRFRFVKTVDLLGMLFEEIEIVLTRMGERSEFSPDVYKPQLDHALATVLNTDQLLAPWRNISGNLTKDVLLSVKFCSQILPKDEDEISAEALAQLQADLAALEISLESASLPSTLKALISRQIERIKSALTAYRVSGAAAIREAAYHAAVDMADHKSEIDAHRGAPELGALGRIIKAAHDIADAVIKADKFIETSSKWITGLLDKLF